MNIPATLAACRAELARQKEMEAKATPGPWVRDIAWVYGPSGFGLKIAQPTYEDITQPIPNAELVCLSRNLNPARLRVAEELLASTQQAVFSMTDEWHLRLAAALLGVECVA